MKVGDKVRIINISGLRNDVTLGEIGIIVKIDEIDSSIPYLLNISNNKIQWAKEFHIELITPSYYSFFKFLHPNMEETTCKELFDKIIKEYESNSGVE